MQKDQEEKEEEEEERERERAQNLLAVLALEQKHF